MNERYLANENFPLGFAQWLIAQGDEVVHASQEMSGVPDPVILQTALARNRILLTFDQDFGELVFRHRHPPAPGIVLFRLHQLSPGEMISSLERFFAAKPTLRGFFTVVHAAHFRQIALTVGSS